MKLYVYQHNNVKKKCNKTYQLIRWFRIFLHLLKDVLSNKQFFDTCFFDNIVKNEYLYQQNSVNKSNKRYELITCFGVFLDLLKNV